MPQALRPSSGAIAALSSGDAARYACIHPVRISRIVPGFSSTPSRDGGLLQIVEAVLFRFERIDRAAVRDAVAERVEQYGAADKLIRPFVDAEASGRPVLDLAGFHAVVERLVARAADVREAVPLAALLGVVAVERVVETEQAEALEAHDVVLGRTPREQRRVGVIDFRIEPEDGALAHQARRVDHALRASGNSGIRVRRRRRTRPTTIPWACRA